MTLFVDWYNHRHRHSGIKFVAPHQRHNGGAVEICRYRAVVYEQARQRHRRRWSLSTRCWHQADVIWIYPPRQESQLQPATFVMASSTGAVASSFLAVTGEALICQYQLHEETFILSFEYKKNRAPLQPSKKEQPY